MSYSNEWKDVTEDLNRQIDELFQIKNCFPAKWTPDEAKPRPGALRRIRDWIARGFGFGKVSVATEQEDEDR